MKMKILLLLLLMVGTVQSLYAKKWPRMEFEKTRIELGQFRWDNPIHRCVFRFKNKGKESLVVQHVVSACGCTKTDYPKDSIQPGETGEIVVTYDGSNRYPGFFERKVTVYTNCKTNRIQLTVAGEMTREDVRL